MKVDLYEKLEVSSDCTDEQIKESYRILAKMYHPDNHNNSSDKVKQMASKKFSDIREAYKTLSDENLRMKYDRLMQSEQHEYTDDEYDDDYIEDDYVDEHGYHSREYAFDDHRQDSQAEHEQQLDDAMLAFRKGMPKIFKVSAIFVGVLGWIMFVSYAFGNWGGYYSEDEPFTVSMYEILSAENDDLRRQLRQSFELSLQLEHSIYQYEQWISELIVEIVEVQNLRLQLEESLQQEDWYDYRLQTESLAAELFTAQHRLGLVEQELGSFIEMALSIHSIHLEMLAAMPGVPDPLFTELWYRHVELLDNLQRLEANLAVGRAH